MTAQERQEQADRDLHAVLSTPEGRRVIFRLGVQAGLLARSFVEGPDGDRLTAYNEGRRSVAAVLFDEAKRVSSSLYRRAWREYFDAEERDALALEKAREEARAASEE